MNRRKIFGLFAGLLTFPFIDKLASVKRSWSYPLMSEQEKPKSKLSLELDRVQYPLPDKTCLYWDGETLYIVDSIAFDAPKEHRRSVETLKKNGFTVVAAPVE
jgi:hypothetical protein